MSYQLGMKFQAKEGLQNVPWIVRKKGVDLYSYISASSCTPAYSI